MKAVCLVVLILGFYYPLYSQLNMTDSLARYQAILSAKQKYQKVISGNSHAYNGEEYVSPIKEKKEIGDPYYFDYDWLEGIVYYDNQLYEDLALRYDIHQDKLLVEYSQGYESIELIKERINYFKINGHTFVRLSPTSDQPDVKEGFYDILFDGNLKIYVRRYKTILEIMDQQIMKVEYINKSKLFLFKDKRFFVINKKNDAFNALAEHKSEIKRFLSKENIRFKSNPELTLVAIANYYDHLKKVK